MSQIRVVLDESEIPDPLVQRRRRHAQSAGAAAGPGRQAGRAGADAGHLPQALLEQEMSAERWIPIPDEVREIYRAVASDARCAAPSGWKKVLGTPAKIYYKYEGVSPAGSHKPNTAVPQAYYNKQAGIKRLATETGAGQWGCVPGARRPDVRPGSARLHGEGELRAEALSAAR